jgi:hypothetical protein
VTEREDDVLVLVKDVQSIGLFNIIEDDFDLWDMESFIIDVVLDSPRGG